MEWITETMVSIFSDFGRQRQNLTHEKSNFLLSDEANLKCTLKIFK